MEMQYTIAENATPDEAEQGRLLFAQTTDFLKVTFWIQYKTN